MTGEQKRVVDLWSRIVSGGRLTEDEQAELLSGIRKFEKTENWPPIMRAVSDRGISGRKVRRAWIVVPALVACAATLVLIPRFQRDDVSTKGGASSLAPSLHCDDGSTNDALLDGAPCRLGSPLRLVVDGPAPPTDTLSVVSCGGQPLRCVFLPTNGPIRSAGGAISFSWQLAGALGIHHLFTIWAPRPLSVDDLASLEQKLLLEATIDVILSDVPHHQAFQFYFKVLPAENAP